MAFASAATKAISQGSTTASYQTSVRRIGSASLTAHSSAARFGQPRIGEIQPRKASELVLGMTRIG